MYFLKRLFHAVWQESGVIAGSSEPQSISRRPGTVDRVPPAAVSISVDSAESKICQHLSKERAVEKPKNNGAAKTWVSACALRYSFCLSLRKPSLWWLIFIPRKGKILLLISSRALRVPISFLRNAHFSSSRNFPLPDSPHQIRWNRFFSFGKRLECCFILLAHFSAQSEKKSNILQSYEKVSYCIGIWRQGRETLQMLLRLQKRLIQIDGKVTLQNFRERKLVCFFHFSP